LQSTLGLPVSGELVRELGEDRSAVRQVAQVSRERGETCHDFALDAKGRHGVRDAFLGVRNHTVDGVAQLTERAPFRFVEGFQVLIDLAAWNIGGLRLRLLPGPQDWYVLMAA
jgi:hypothetical protein